MWLETLRASENHEEKCPTCGGGVHRRIYGEMYAGAQILDGERVEMRLRVADGFADPIVLDPLAQYFAGRIYRIWPAERYFAVGGSRLHRDVWRSAFGPIPAGCHIHHRDGNSANNALSNLECLPAREHLRADGIREMAQREVHFTAASRAKALEWHRSEVGRAWHSRMGKRQKSWTKWKRVEKPCEHCGKVVAMVERKSGNAQKYCSETCKALAYRKRNGIKWDSRRMVPDGS